MHWVPEREALVALLPIFRVILIHDQGFLDLLLSTGLGGCRRRNDARARASLTGRVGPPVPVRAVVDRVVRVLRRTPRGQELDWEIDVADAVRVAVDADDLAEMLGNLAENAVKWARSIVRIVGRTDTGGLLLAVEDDGPGIPADGVETVVLRGARLDEAQPSTGLGLAIVSDLAVAYGAPLTFGRSPLGGLQATIRLPAPH